ncbi:MAG: GDSL-type esterase/lipase family protein [Myxococcota bacterium]
MRTSTAESGGRTDRARRIGLALGLLALLLVVAELGLGYWAHHLRTPYEGWDTERGTPTLIPGRYATPFGVVSIDARGFVAEAESAADLPVDVAPSGVAGDRRDARIRIAALGDSCTFGAGDPESTWPAALARRLARETGGGSSPRAAHGRVAAVVVNAGIAGLRSDEAIGRLAYTLAVVHPDVVPIYLGWNDLMKDAPRSQTRAAPLSRLWRAIDDLWLVRGLRKLLFFHLRARFGAPRTGPAGETGRFTGFRPDHFEANLHHLIAATRAAGARPLLVTLPHSLRRDLTPMELLDPIRQYPYFWAGNALGDFVDLIDRYNETIRRVAESEAVPVADLAARFDRIERKPAYFLDTMHPNRRGNELIAEVLERTLQEQGMLVRSPETAASGQEE